MMRWRKYYYYFQSIIRLITSVKPLGTVLGIFLTPNRNAGEKSNNSRIRLPRQRVAFNVRGAMDVWSVKETFLDRFYERYGSLIKPGWNIVDIGAGIGDFTTLAAQAYPDNRVLAFEPTPESFQLLEENILINKVKNARVFPLAIWSEENNIWIDTTTGEPGQYISRSHDGSDDMVGLISVSSITLSQVCQIHELETIDLLKMDCEGAEYAILFNTPAAVLVKIRRIIMEYHDNISGYSHLDLERFLIVQGFNVQVTPNVVHSYLGYLYAWRPSD